MPTKQSGPNAKGPVKGASKKVGGAPIKSVTKNGGNEISRKGK